ncbi:hypothetical protein FKG94_16270 [Exilibacterium tricleocarpae]|uniref:Uncharacterized protein n=1 Tax=Exilibacterium tricleocarpae TaxID=2591008 RepID=A0A545TAB7_9GAMM|nr:hypothetical protein [Exilibacterium tricleocarpae]TQV74163.1 hypothetical protein FKG94_16270 [Exilibacterium tricleocarpae]
MDQTKWYKSPEMLVALSALFIGVLTAIISIYSAYIDRAYARASVWPKLEIYRSFRGDTFSYVVANRGTGPAIIEYAKINVGEKIIKRWDEVDIFSKIGQSHISSVTLTPEQTVTPLLYEGDLVSDILELDKSIGMELCYCSVYGDCWVVNRNNEAKPTGECFIKNEEAFIQ